MLGTLLWLVLAPTFGQPSRTALNYTPNDLCRGVMRYFSLRDLEFFGSIIRVHSDWEQRQELWLRNQGRTLISVLGRTLSALRNSSTSIRAIEYGRDYGRCLGDLAPINSPQLSQESYLLCPEHLPSWTESIRSSLGRDAGEMSTLFWDLRTNPVQESGATGTALRFPGVTLNISIAAVDNENAFLEISLNELLNRVDAVLDAPRLDALWLRYLVLDRSFLLHHREPVTLRQAMQLALPTRPECVEPLTRLFIQSGFTSF